MGVDEVPLVTGGTGFAGGHLIELLLRTHQQIAAWFNPSGARPPADAARVAWSGVDLLDGTAVERAITAIRPSVIYHCGGIADVAASWTRPERALKVNALGTHHVIDAVRRTGIECTVLVTGSALVYRASPHPLSEASPIGPSTPYGFSKLAQEMIALRSSPVRVVVARPFNHAGPRQSDAYVTSSFARQIAESEAGLRPPIVRVGNLESRRDITDVRDTVAAYVALVERGEDASPYNVCSGRAYVIRELLDILRSIARVPIAVETDPARMRPSDNPIVIGDPSRIREHTGWAPQIGIERTLLDLLENWRSRVVAA